MATSVFLDQFRRPLRNLRLSVTDRCNLRCSYCMPEPEYVWLPREDILRFEEIERLVDVFLDLGVDKLRLTGGAPLLRRDLPALVERLAGLDPVDLMLGERVAQGAIDRLQASLAADPDFGPPSLVPNPAARAALLHVPLAHDPASTEAIDAVRRLRDDLIPRAFEGVDARAFVTGVTAGNLEFFDVTDQYTPIVFAFVLGISFLLLAM